MNILTSLTKKYLILNKKRTIVTIIGIILSCALICSVAILIKSFQNFFINTAIEGSGPQHAIYGDVPIDKVNYIEQNTYLKESYKSKNMGYILLEGSLNTNKPYLSLLAYDSVSFKENKIKLTSGHLPKNSNEVVISNEAITDGGVKYKLGDKVTFKIGQRALNGETIGDSFYPVVDEKGNKETFDYQYSNEYTIGGFIEKPQYEPFYSPGYQVITYLDNKLLSNLDSVDISVINKNPNKSYVDLTKIAKQLKLKEIEFNDSLLRWYGVSDKDNANKTFYTIGLTLIIVIMIASIIVIHNSFNISVTERKKQFGMLASIGATTKQLRNMVLKEGFILSIIGIPLGILLSIVGIGLTLMFVNHLNIFGGFYSTKLELVIEPLAILVAIAFCGLTIFLSSLIPAIKTARISPIDAIRLTSDVRIKGRKLKTSKLTRKLFGIEGELGLKSMKRSKKKYRSTIISIFVSIVLFMAINGFANYSFKSSIKVYKDYNYNIAIRQNKPSSKYSVFYDQVAKIKDITNYSIVRNINALAYFDKKDLNPKVIANTNYDSQKNKYIVPVLLSTLGKTEFNRYIKDNKLSIDDYNDVNNPKAIIMKNSEYIDYNNSKMYDLALTNMKVGNKLDLYYNNDNGSILANKIEVGSFIKTYPIGFGNENRSAGAIQGYISDNVYDSFNDNIKFDNMMFIDSKKASDTEKKINELAGQEKIDINIVNIDENAKKISNVVLAIDIFLYGFITLVSLITVTNVINTITTSIYLRRTEFAMIKAVGMTNKEFNRMIRFENVYYGLKSLIYGLPIGILIDYFLYKNVSSVFVYDYQFPISSVLVCIVSVAIIITITMTYSIRKIRSDNIIDAIKQENL